MSNRRLSIVLFIGLLLIVAARARAAAGDELTTRWRIGQTDGDIRVVDLEW